MTACIANGILKTEEWIEHETQYVNGYLKKINIWNGITDQIIGPFR